MESPSFEYRCDPAFAAMLGANYINALETHPYSAYGLWPDLTLAYMNPAWFAFADGNGGKAMHTAWPVGRSTLDAIPAAIKAWYLRFFAATRISRGAHPQNHEYECSSAEVYRRFMMTIYPLAAGPQSGYLISNSLLLTSSSLDAKGPERAAMVEEYADGVGLIRR